MLRINRIHRNSGTRAYRSVMNVTTALTAHLMTAKDNLRNQMQYPTVQLLPDLMASMLSTPAEHYNNDHNINITENRFGHGYIFSRRSKKDPHESASATQRPMTAKSILMVPTVATYAMPGIVFRPPARTATLRLLFNRISERNQAWQRSTSLMMLRFEKVVKRSEELAQLAPENPEFVGPLPQQTYGESKTYFESTAKITPDYRAQAAANSINSRCCKGCYGSRIPGRQSQLCVYDEHQRIVCLQSIHWCGLHRHHALK